MKAKIVLPKVMIISIQLVFLFVLLGCSGMNNHSTTSKLIPDAKLITLYGGSWWQWFDNPYCVAGGGCPPQGGCPDSGYEGWNCVICSAQSGTTCHPGRSILPDYDGCSVSTPDCSVAKHGFCGIGQECQEGGGIAGDYPTCGTYSQCND